LAEDSSYETGARCLLQWIHDNESVFWQNEGHQDDLQVDLECAVRAAFAEGPEGHILSLELLAAPSDYGI
jgi:hypothetical protein